MYHFAIIGCGHMGSRHAEVIKTIGKLVAVCDMDPAKATALASVYGAHPYASLEELLEMEKKVDVICVCTPVGCHAEHAIRSLQAGMHVLCESPLCLTSAAAWQMIETEKYCGRKMFVVDRANTHPALASIGPRVAEDPETSFEFSVSASHPAGHYKGWRGKSFPGGGLLYTDFNEEVSLLRTIFGGVEKVEGFASNLAHHDTIEFEDAGSVSIISVNGYRGKFSWSINKDDGRKLVLREKDNVTELDLGAPNDTGFEQVYQQFLQVIEENRQSNLLEATATVEAIERIYKALTPNPA